MKSFYVIEADTELYSVHVREVTQSFHANEVRYSCKPDAAIPIMDNPSPEFYGKLNALLITRRTLEMAEPIEPAEVSDEVE